MKRLWPLHVLLWSVYLLVESYIEFLRIFPGFPADPTWYTYTRAFISELAILVPKIAMVYILFSILFRSGTGRRWWLIAVQAILTLAITIIIRRAIIIYLLDPLLFGTVFGLQPLLTVELAYYSVFEVSVVAGFALALEGYRQKQMWREREKSLVNEKLESELKFLKAQINPHFLFNTLNSIYALARKQSDKTPDAVLKLSKLMRFMLFEARKERIALVDEIKLIGDYIELEKLRYNSKVSVDFKSCVDDESQEIAPLLLIHFVENAFKHGVGEARHSSKISIDIFLSRGSLSAIFINSVEEVVPAVNGEQIGLMNIKRQLELLYPRHSLDLRREGLKYEVRLSIPLA